MYNPDIHHRMSVRLKNYDYSQNGAYFVTICTHNRECLFGEVVESAMIVNEYGAIAGDEWLQLEMRFTSVKLDAFQIMPNHIHGIIRIVGAGLAPALRVTADERATARVAQNADTGQPQGLPIRLPKTKRLPKQGQRRALPLRLAILLRRINHWFINGVWICAN